MDKFDIQVERNLKGIKLEKLGKIEEAVKLYEANVKEYFTGTHPYDRLLVYYRKNKLINEEIRILKQVIEIYTGLLNSPQIGIQKELDRYKSRLERLINNNTR